MLSTALNQVGMAFNDSRRIGDTNGKNEKKIALGYEHPYTLRSIVSLAMAYRKQER